MDIGKSFGVFQGLKWVLLRLGRWKVWGPRGVWCWLRVGLHKDFESLLVCLLSTLGRGYVRPKAPKF